MLKESVFEAHFHPTPSHYEEALWARQLFSRTRLVSKRRLDAIRRIAKKTKVKAFEKGYDEGALRGANAARDQTRAAFASSFRAAVISTVHTILKRELRMDRRVRDDIISTSLARVGYSEEVNQVSAAPMQLTAYNENGSAVSLDLDAHIEAIIERICPP